MTPEVSERIYLDYNSTAPCRDEALARMSAAVRIGGNPSNAHREGREARAILEAAREQVARAIGAEPAEIVFTSGGTEADNLAILGVVGAGGAQHPHVVTSKIEHLAVLAPCRHLASRGVRVSFASCDESGRVRAETVRAILDEDVVLVSIMHANNETGVIQPVSEMARLARERGVPMHTDAVQSMGKIPVNVKDLGVDLLSISSHKIGGPKGVGALFVRRGVRLQPLMLGGHQEQDRRAGTENVPAIAAFGVAAAAAAAAQATESARLARFKILLWEGLRERVGGVQVNGGLEDAVSNTLNVSFDGVDGESLMMALDLEGVAVSTGSACTGGAVEPSHVLEAMCFGKERCRGAIRFSMGFRTAEEETRRALVVLARVVRRMRG